MSMYSNTISFLLLPWKANLNHQQYLVVRTWSGRCDGPLLLPGGHSEGWSQSPQWWPCQLRPGSAPDRPPGCSGGRQTSVRPRRSSSLPEISPPPSPSHPVSHTSSLHLAGRGYWATIYVCTHLRRLMKRLWIYKPKCCMTVFTTWHECQMPWW